MFRLSRPASPPLDNATSSSIDTSTACRHQALTRSTAGKLARHHPNVKLPPRMEEKPKVEQIRRCCDRFKSHPYTVDTLIRALSTILSHPSEGKYRRINQTNPGYQRSLAKVSGAEQLLFALGFEQRDSKSLFLARIDHMLLPLSLTILEETKETVEYQQAKQAEVFSKEMTAQLRTTPVEHERVQRKKLLSLVPNEPSRGRSAVIMIQLGDIDSTTLTRRFDGDDTLQDVLHWLGGTTGTPFLEKLYNSSHSLVDVNRQGQVPIDCQTNQYKTLQHLGFWPSGRLSLRPSSSEWIERATNASVEIGKPRVLG